MDGSYHWDYSLVHIWGVFHFQVTGRTLPCSEMMTNWQWRVERKFKLHVVLLRRNSTDGSLNGSTLCAATLGSFSWAGLAELGEGSRPRVTIPPQPLGGHCSWPITLEMTEQDMGCPALKTWRNVTSSKWSALTSKNRGTGNHWWLLTVLAKINYF